MWMGDQRLFCVVGPFLSSLRGKHRHALWYSVSLVLPIVVAAVAVLVIIIIDNDVVLLVIITTIII